MFLIMLKLLRILAILEGVSYLLLFAVGMPLKYWGEIPKPNIYIGYAHGFLFIVFMVLAVLLTMERSWGRKRLLLMFAAALLPFGTFYLEEHYLRNNWEG